MNWVDFVIIGAVGLGMVNGFRRGALMQAFSWGGFLAGIVLAGFVTLPLMEAVGPDAPYAKSVAALATFLGLAFLIEGLAAFGGARLVRRFTGATFRRVDAVTGSLVAGLLALTAAWMLSVPAKGVPEIATAVRRSAILRAEYRILPNPPNFLATIGSLLDRTGFPEVFAQLNPSLAPDVEPAPRALANDAQVQAAARLTFKIESEGCGGRVDGSGFPAGGGTVVTAAHVVAGTSRTRVIEARDAGGASFPATVVYFDPAKDLAVLRVPGLPRDALRVDPRRAGRGTDGAAIGYPGGGPRTISVARVRARTDARGRDIFSRRQVTREIYVLRAVVKQGNSGGPFVDTDGRVRGMIFAASSDNREESYALAETEIERALRRAGTARASTGKRCAV